MPALWIVGGMGSEESEEEMTLEELEKEAIMAAQWVTCSPHEWEWTHEQQIAMARYCMEAARQLALWKWLTDMRCTVEESSMLFQPKWWVLDVDGECLAKSDTPLDAIDLAVARTQEQTE